MLYLYKLFALLGFRFYLHKLSAMVFFVGNDLRQNVDFEREETALQIFLGYGNFM